MQRVITVIVALLLSLSFSQAVFADHHGHGEMCKKKLEKMFKKMKLTDEQKKKIDAIRAQYEVDKKALKAKYKNLKEQMHAAVKSAPGEKNAMNALIKQKQAMVADYIKLKVKMKQGIYQLLTPEQRTQFEKMWHAKKDTKTAS